MHADNIKLDATTSLETPSAVSTKTSSNSSAKRTLFFGMPKITSIEEGGAQKRQRVEGDSFTSSQTAPTTNTPTSPRGFCFVANCTQWLAPRLNSLTRHVPPAVRALFAAASSPPEPVQMSKTVQELVEYFDSFWKVEDKKFVGIKFDETAFKELVNQNNSSFAPIYNSATDYGVVQKKDVSEGAKIFVRADLHGDLKSLVENLKALKGQGLLDENYKCAPHVHLVFLGDYGDRGRNTMQVLELLIRLRMENPENVTLMRGNHEDIRINRAYCDGDENFIDFLYAKEQKEGYMAQNNREDNQALLTALYATLSLSLYVAQGKESGRREYVQFVHGVPELYVDPAELLGYAEPVAQLIVTQMRELSERVKAIETDLDADYAAQLKAETDKAVRKILKFKHAAQTLKKLWERENNKNENHDYTIYNWGDIAVKEFWSDDKVVTSFGDPGARQWKLAPIDLQHLFRLASPDHKVKLLIRGHEHLKQHHEVEKVVNGVTTKKTIVSTMPVGMDSVGYATRFEGQLDTAYILTTAERVRDWTKMAYLRKPGEAMHAITAPVAIRNTTI